MKRAGGAGRIPNAWPRAMMIDVAASYVSLSVSTFRKEVQKGRAPQPHRITEGRLIWLLEDLNVYLDRIAGRNESYQDSRNEWLDDEPGPAVSVRTSG